MAHISLRVSEEDKDFMNNYAKLHGISLSAVLINSFFETVEAEMDMKSIDEYEKEKATGNIKYYSHNEVGKILGVS